MFTVGAVFREARAIIKPKCWFIVKQYVMLALAAMVFSVSFGNGSLIVSFVVAYAAGVLALGYAKNGSFSFAEFFSAVTFKKIVYYVLALTLAGLAMLGGFMLLIIPGFVVLTMLSLVSYVAIDQDVTPREALRVSMQLTKGNRWKIFGFFLLAILINLLGMICLFVGLFYTIPLTKIAFAIVYKKLSVATPAPVEVAQA